MDINDAEYRARAETVARDAELLANGGIPDGKVFTHVARLVANAATLKAWTKDDREY